MLTRPDCITITTRPKSNTVQRRSDCTYNKHGACCLLPQGHSQQHNQTGPQAFKLVGSPAHKASTAQHQHRAGLHLTRLHNTLACTQHIQT